MCLQPYLRQRCDSWPAGSSGPPMASSASTSSSLLTGESDSSFASLRRPPRRGGDERALISENTRELRAWMAAVEAASASSSELDAWVEGMVPMMECSDWMSESSTGCGPCPRSPSGCCGGGCSFVRGWGGGLRPTRTLTRVNERR